MDLITRDDVKRAMTETFYESVGDYIDKVDGGDKDTAFLSSMLFAERAKAYKRAMEVIDSMTPTKDVWAFDANAKRELFRSLESEVDDDYPFVDMSNPTLEEQYYYNEGINKAKEIVRAHFFVAQNGDGDGV